MQYIADVHAKQGRYVKIYLASYGGKDWWNINIIQVDLEHERITDLIGDGHFLGVVLEILDKKDRRRSEAGTISEQDRVSNTLEFRKEQASEGYAFIGAVGWSPDDNRSS